MRKMTVSRIKLADYESRHRKKDCAGRFSLSYTTHAPYSGSALGLIRLPIVPLIVCYKCEAGFIAPGFREWIEEIIARHLAESPGLLSKRQIRFLRQFFDLTQEDLARKVGIADRFELSKMESPHSKRTMDPDKQFRLKLVAAKMLGLRDASRIFELNESNVDREIAIDPAKLIDGSRVKDLFRVA